MGRLYYMQKQKFSKNRGEIMDIYLIGLETGKPQKLCIDDSKYEIIYNSNKEGDMI